MNEYNENGLRHFKLLKELIARVVLIRHNTKKSSVGTSTRCVDWVHRQQYLDYSIKALYFEWSINNSRGQFTGANLRDIKSLYLLLTR